MLYFLKCFQVLEHWGRCFEQVYILITSAIRFVPTRPLIAHASVTSKLLNTTYKVRCQLTPTSLASLILCHPFVSSIISFLSQNCNFYLQLRKCISPITPGPVYMHKLVECPPLLLPWPTVTPTAARD